ncbi:hypothetical protein L2E82_45415 [Cichorium intybus]|uniref:Uncharacterized protein n=1 Tax=Cichorium intybus TaxID=13427 RepID=A0ACB8ZRY7_CICIN|nr:hypothetical protein L2E82_45415 [Cichorium intybus]
MTRKTRLTGRILGAISGRSLKLEARTWINCWKMVISKQIRARCAQGPGGVRPGAVRPSPGAVWDKMVVVHAKTRNNRDLNATSIQIVENWCDLMAMIPGVEPKLIRLLTELCSSYRLLNVPAGHGALRGGPALSQGSIERGATRQVAENPHGKQQ